MRGDWCWVVVGLVGCGSPTDEDAPDPTPPADVGPLEAEVRYVLPERELEPLDEEIVCVSLTLHNEESLYVHRVDLTNLGAFHHGNWFVVGQDVYEGPDGYWPCEDRDFNEIEAALSGSVLFAQSTQARTESMNFAEGAVIRIPPRSKIVADLHLLNPAPQDVITQAWLELLLVHPRRVRAPLTPLTLSYLDLLIPSGTRTRHTASCRLPASVSLHYVLPHYHALGEFFELAATRNTQDWETLHLHQGFDAAPLGRTYDPPVELSDVLSLRFSCGYNNWLDRDLGWGIGVNEMCVALLLVDSPELITGAVLDGQTVVYVEEGVHFYEGECQVAAAPTPHGFGTGVVEAELRRPLYIPPVPDTDAPPPPTCTDAAAQAEPVADATLTAVRAHVFEPSCVFSSCHGAAAAGGLDLRAEGLHGRLMAHTVRRATDLALVEPEDPQRSLLYRVLSECAPPGGGPMPANAPWLLDDRVVAMVREWIAAGAPDD